MDRNVYSAWNVPNIEFAMLSCYRDFRFKRFYYIKLLNTFYRTILSRFASRLAASQIWTLEASVTQPVHRGSKITNWRSEFESIRTKRINKGYN